MGLSDKINTKKAETENDESVVVENIEIVAATEEAKIEVEPKINKEVKTEDDAITSNQEVKTINLSAVKTDKLKRQILASGKGVPPKMAPNSNASRLHAHLNMVGEDGLMHKDRIELELREQAKKVKKIIYSACGVILLLVILGFAISSCSKSNKSPRKTAPSKRFSIKTQNYKNVDEALIASNNLAHTMLSQKETLYTPEKFNKVFDDLILLFPNDKAKIDAGRESMKKMYLL